MKSRAEELHDDAIIVEEKRLETKEEALEEVSFHTFCRCLGREDTSTFSLSLSRGFELVRKQGEEIVKISRSESYTRVPMLPTSYIQREAIAIKELESLPKQLDFSSEFVKEN